MTATELEGFEEWHASEMRKVVSEPSTVPPSGASQRAQLEQDAAYCESLRKKIDEFRQSWEHNVLVKADLAKRLQAAESRAEQHLQAYDRAVIDGENAEKRLIEELQAVRLMYVESESRAERLQGEVVEAVALRDKWINYAYVGAVVPPLVGNVKPDKPTKLDEALELLRQLDPWIGTVTNACQVFDGWHNDGTAWSEWDESIRKELSAMLKKLYEIAALLK